MPPEALTPEAEEPTAAEVEAMMSEDVRQPADGSQACAYCGKPFFPLMASAKYCTALCRRKASDERAKAARRGD